MTSDTIHRSSAQARGERVRRLRNMANLSRQDICKTSDFKIDTLIGWEVGRHGGLTEKGAQKIIERVAKEGVISTLEWLLHETGIGPAVIADFATDHSNSEIALMDDDKKIIEEFLFFKKHYPQAIGFCMNDNSMHPNYACGDYVAGIKCDQNRWSDMVGQDCIVQPFNGPLTVRKLLPGGKKGRFTLVPVNLESDANPVILTDVELVDVAPVIWHRRKNTLL